MAKIHIDCPECSEKGALSTTSKEDVQFCPFCGASIVLPFEDEDDSPDDEEDDDED